MLSSLTEICLSVCKKVYIHRTCRLLCLFCVRIGSEFDQRWKGKGGIKGGNNIAVAPFD